MLMFYVTLVPRTVGMLLTWLMDYSVHKFVESRVVRDTLRPEPNDMATESLARPMLQPARHALPVGERIPGLN